MTGGPYFETLDVSAWPLIFREPAGREPKDWILQPGVGRRWLFKPIHLNTAGKLQGEDWAEKVASELASLMGVAHARIELARRNGLIGCISQDVAPSHWDLQSGAVALTAVVPNFHVGGRERSGHSLANIRKVLLSATCPSDAMVPASFNAFDLFCGYLVFDAWIANRDRHEENWALLRPPPDSLDRDTLSPSFDHASSLGFQLEDDRRSRILSTGELEAWVQHGTAWRFQRPKNGVVPTLVEHATAALAMASPGTGEYWLRRLAAVESAHILDILSRTERMSEPARTFVSEMLELNRRRLLG